MEKKVKNIKTLCTAKNLSNGMAMGLAFFIFQSPSYFLCEIPLIMHSQMASRPNNHTVQ